ncbi:short chain dehydrogenase [Haematomicrobium sanguinis]|uniref:short chain dehydrogenase n=1 Tax=Haematomicrobium sanguinis TaxID=479106 RepID=UPI00047A13B2|nr:short chain dehydrogenase [Haematomicrobium sanguinis]
MRILVIGASGTVGAAAVTALKERHEKFGEGRLEILEAHRDSSEYPVDITNSASVGELFAKVRDLDAVVSAAGPGHMAPVSEATVDDYRKAAEGKLFSQIGIALAARKVIKPGGSITLTSGILSDAPIPAGSPLAVANAGVNAFVTTSAAEFAPLRINAVSPNLLTESVDTFGGAMAGFIPVDGLQVAQGFVRSVYGADTGQVIKVW